MSNSGNGENWVGFFKDGVTYGTEQELPPLETEDKEENDKDT